MGVYQKPFNFSKPYTRIRKNSLIFRGLKIPERAFKTEKSPDFSVLIHHLVVRGVYFHWLVLLLVLIKIRCPMRAFCRFTGLMCTLLVMSLPVRAQQDTGRQPLDPGVFAQNLEEQYDRYQSEKVQQVVASFLAKWEGETFSTREQREVISLFRRMRSGRYRATGGLKDYLAALTKAKERGITQAQFTDWHAVLDQMIGERRDLNKVNQTLASYFGQRGLYLSRSKDWFTEGFLFNIGYQNGAPRITFDRATHLFCATKADTMHIYGAKGYYNPVSQRWKGRKGEATWERVGKSPDRVYAQLDRHAIKLPRGRISDDSVAFFNKHIRQEAMVGSFKDRVFIAEQKRDSRYPQFSSTSERYRVDGFFPQVRYRGGFSMKGNSIIGTKVEDHLAKVTMLRQGKPRISSKADRFVIDPNRIVSSETAATVFFKQDSIYHSDVDFRYLHEQEQVRLIKGDRGLTASPFYDSYHGIEIDVDQVIWDINKPRLKMRMTLNSVEPARITSNNFYQEGRFDKVQGILSYNPLKELKLYAERINSYRMTLKGLAGYLGIGKDNMQRMLVGLHQKGFLDYDKRSGTVIVRDKLVHYVEANKGLTDFDNIDLRSSNPDSANAKLDFKSGDMQIAGVPRVNLSDSQRVSIYPADSQITMQEDRDMSFEGEMFAGRFQFFGDGFSFNYDSFKVEMDNVDSLRLYYPDEETGRLVPVKNVIEDIYGDVYIDDPNNKSGQVELPEYPIFDAKEESAVYYEDPNIYNNVYPEDSFYFQIKPFVAKNLDEFERKEIQFDGTFYSAQILPVFDHYITIMPDNSLGFSKRTPSDGFDLYQGKGTGTMEIKLSSKGLRGAGLVEYLPSSTESQQFVFFPDSMNATTESFNIPKEGQDRYPPVTGKTTYNHWLPYKDSMFIRERDPLSVYNEEVTFNGDLVLTPEELYGAGKLRFEQAVIGSNALAMKPTEVNTDTASFKLKSKEQDKDPNFYTPDAGLTLDFDKRQLDGEANGEKADVSFKQHQFRTTIKGFNWRIDSQSMYMTTTKDQAVSEAFMQSTKKGQDSLQFNTTAAYFDLSESTIEARNIPDIKVADAAIYPSDGSITIDEGADLQTLEDARIVADTAEKYHEFYDAQVNIFGRDEYAAKGTYDYKDRNGQPQPLVFGTIRTNERGRTIADAELEEQTDFQLSPRFTFNGDVSLKADRENLLFDGLLKPANRDSLFGTQAFQFKDIVQPDSLLIRADSLKGKDGSALVSGMYIDTATHELYDVFLGTKHAPQDLALFEAEGFLHYDYYEGEYVIEREYNLSKPDSMPYQFTYSDQNGQLQARGPLNIGFDDHKHLDIRTIGKATYLPEDSTHSFDVVMGIDFPFNQEALGMASDSLINLAFPLDDSKDGRQVVQDASYYLIDDRQTRISVLSSVRSFGTFVSNEVYQPNFFFTDVELTWAPRQQAFLDTSVLGLATLGKAAVNKQLKGKLRFKLSRDDRRLRFYTGATTGNYYYFNIGREACKVYSSDYYFNKKVQETGKDVSKSNFQIKPLGDRKEKIFFQQSATIREP